MTFGASKRSLERDEHILRKWTTIDGYPRDSDMFTELTKQWGRTMLCPIPGYILSELHGWYKENDGVPRC